MKAGHRPVVVRVRYTEEATRVVWVPDNVRDHTEVNAFAQRDIMSMPPSERLGPGSHAHDWAMVVTSDGA